MMVFHKKAHIVIVVFFIFLFFIKLQITFLVTINIFYRLEVEGAAAALLLAVCAE
jgi:hypothetical protein